MKNITLNEKLILYFLCLGLGTIFLISIYSYYSTQDALMSRTFDQLTSLRIAKKNHVEIFFKDRIKEVILLSGSDDTRTIAEMQDKAPEKESKRELSVYLRKYKSLTGYFASVMIISGNNKFVKGYTADPVVESGSLKPVPVNPAIPVSIRDEMIDPADGKVKMFMDAPIFTANHKPAGRIVLELPEDQINTIMLNNDPNSGL